MGGRPLLWRRAGFSSMKTSTGGKTRGRRTSCGRISPSPSKRSSCRMSGINYKKTTWRRGCRLTQKSSNGNCNRGYSRSTVGSHLPPILGSCPAKTLCAHQDRKSHQSGPAMSPAMRDRQSSAGQEPDPSLVEMGAGTAQAVDRPTALPHSRSLPYYDPVADAAKANSEAA